MRRRSKASSEPAKTRRRKTVTLKRGSAPKAVRRRASSTTGREAKVARLISERDEALGQQTATSDILKVISRQRSTCRWCSIRWLSRRPAFAIQTMRGCSGVMARFTVGPPAMAFPGKDTSKSSNTNKP